uniref:Uncharacterized protein n=1 Tax=Arundo donax TaxID=35708 RepID=A0A0A8Y4Y6_ARUDO
MRFYTLDIRHLAIFNPLRFLDMSCQCHLTT